MIKAAVQNIDMPHNISYMEYAQMTKGIYMNLMSGCRYNEITGEYETIYLISKGGPLFGQNVKTPDGDYTCVYSCLGTSYRDDPSVRAEWKKAREDLIKDYQDQVALEKHIKTNNIDLKKLH